MEGYNATVLAYGQTGSGKTYTMGTAYAGASDETPVGIVPRVLEEVLQAAAEKEASMACTVTMSYLEIYNEQVRDLLWKGGDAEPRHMLYKDAFGNYEVKGLTDVPVTSLDELSAALTSGAQRRTTASTAMNAVSSRSHAIITLKLVQRPMAKGAHAASPGSPAAVGDAELAEGGGCDEGEDLDAHVVKTSLFRLVDLAGSERSKKTGAEGTRLREANNINQSLTTLGLCITALASRARHIPFRNSKLTQLLTNSLGGNSATTMIACVSPADSNYEETLLTLRYADAASSIENKPVVNADPVGASNVHLRHTISVLKTELSRLYADGAPVSPSILSRFQLGGSVCPFSSPSGRRTVSRTAGRGGSVPAMPPPPPCQGDSRPITGTGAGRAFAAAAAVEAGGESEEVRHLRCRVRELEADLEVTGAELASTRATLTNVSTRGQEMCALANAVSTQHAAALTAADKWRWRFTKVTQTLSGPLPGAADTEEGAAATAAAGATAPIPPLDEDGEGDVTLAAESAAAAAASAGEGGSAPSDFASEAPVLSLLAEKNCAITALQGQVARLLSRKGVAQVGIGALMMGSGAPLAGLHCADSTGGDAEDGADEGAASGAEDEDLTPEHHAAADAAAAAVHAATAAPAEEEVAAMAARLQLTGQLSDLQDTIAAKERLFAAAQATVGVQLEGYESLRSKFKEEIRKQEEEMEVLLAKVATLTEELEVAKAEPAAGSAGAGSGSRATSSALKAKDDEIRAMRARIAALEKGIAQRKREAERKDREAARLRSLKDSIESAKRERVDLEKRLREAAKAHAVERRARAKEAASLAKAHRSAQLQLTKQAAELEKASKALQASRQRERLARAKEAEAARKRLVAQRVRAAGPTPSSHAGGSRTRRVLGRTQGRGGVASADLGSLGGGRSKTGAAGLGDLLGDTSCLDETTAGLLQEAVATASAEAAAGEAGDAGVPTSGLPVTGTPTTLRQSRTLPEEVQEVVARVLALRCRKAAWRAERESAAEERSELAHRLAAAVEGGEAGEEVDALKRAVVALTHRMARANEGWSALSAEEEAAGLAANKWMAKVAACAGRGGRRASGNLAGRLLNWLLSMLIHAQLALHQAPRTASDASGSGSSEAAAAGARAAELESVRAAADAHETIASLRQQLAKAQTAQADAVTEALVSVLADAGVEAGSGDVAAAVEGKISALRGQLRSMEELMATYMSEAAARADQVQALTQEVASLRAAGGRDGDTPQRMLHGSAATQEDDDGEEHALQGAEGISDADLRLGLGLDGARSTSRGSSAGAARRVEGPQDSDDDDEFSSNAADALGEGAVLHAGAQRRPGAAAPRRSVMNPTVASAARAQSKSVKAFAAHGVGFGGTVFGGEEGEEGDEAGDEASDAHPRRGTRSVHSRATGEALAQLRRRTGYSSRRRSVGASELPTLAAEAVVSESHSTTLQALIQPSGALASSDKGNVASTRGTKRTRGRGASAGRAEPPEAQQATPPKRPRAGSAM